MMCLYIMKLLDDQDSIEEIIYPALFKKYEHSYLAKVNAFTASDKTVLKIEKEFEDMLNGNDNTKEILDLVNKSKNH